MTDLSLCSRSAEAICVCGRCECKACLRFRLRDFADDESVSTSSCCPDPLFIAWRIFVVVVFGMGLISSLGFQAFDEPGLEIWLTYWTHFTYLIECVTVAGLIIHTLSWIKEGFRFTRKLSGWTGVFFEVSVPLAWGVTLLYCMFTNIFSHKGTFLVVYSTQMSLQRNLSIIPPHTLCTISPMFQL